MESNSLAHFDLLGYLSDGKLILEVSIDNFVKRIGSTWLKVRRNLLTEKSFSTVTIAPSRRIEIGLMSSSTHLQFYTNVLRLARLMRGLESMLILYRFILRIS